RPGRWGSPGGVRGRIRTRAMACLRRPVAAAGAVMISRGVTVVNDSVEDSEVKLSGASSATASSATASSAMSLVGGAVVSATFLSVSLVVTVLRGHGQHWVWIDRRAYCATWVISNGVGAWAWCGCEGPAYTFSLDSIARPRVLCGSIPFTAFSTARSGCFSSRSLYLVARSPPG